MECSDIGFPFLFGYRLARTFFTYNGSDRSKPIILRPHPHIAHLMIVAPWLASGDGLYPNSAFSVGLLGLSLSWFLVLAR